MIRAIVAFFATFVAFSASAAPPQYVVTDLETLAWASPTPNTGSRPGLEAYDRNAAGEVGINNAISHAYLLRQGNLTDLGVLPGALSSGSSQPSSVGRGLNSQAHVVGSSDSPYYHSAVGLNAPATHAVLWNGNMQDLGTLNGDPGFMSVAESVNDFDEIVGFSEIYLNTGLLTDRAFVWISGHMYNITSYIAQSYPNVRLTDAVSINCAGNIAALGYDVRKPTLQKYYLLTRIGPARTSCP